MCSRVYKEPSVYVLDHHSAGDAAPPPSSSSTCRQAHTGRGHRGETGITFTQLDIVCTSGKCSITSMSCHQSASCKEQVIGWKIYYFCGAHFLPRFCVIITVCAAAHSSIHVQCRHSVCGLTAACWTGDSVCALNDNKGRDNLTSNVPLFH